MSLKNWTHSKGVTLIELIIVIALVALVLGVVFSLFLFGNRTFSKSSQQYDAQSDVRIVMDTAVKELRYATAVKLISLDEAKDTHAYRDGYHYLYLDNNQLIIRTWTVSGREERVIGSDIVASTSYFEKKADNTITLVVKSGSGDNSYLGETSLKLLNIAASNGTQVVEGSGKQVGIEYQLKP